MRSTREIEERIRRFQEIGKIVLSMKSIASMNVQRAHLLIDNLRGYEEEITLSIKTILSHFPEVRLSFEGEERVIVVYGSDQGLCGLFNERIGNFVKRRFQGDDGIHLVLVGKKLGDVIQERVLRVLGAPVSYESIYAHASELIELISEMYLGGNIGEVYLAYNEFRGIGSYAPRLRKVVPFEVKREEIYTFPPITDMPPEEILSGLVVEYLYSNLYSAYLESFLSENGVRLMNMNNASRSIERTIGELEIEKNYFRQEEITSEIEEILTAYKELSEE